MKGLTSFYFVDFMQFGEYNKPCFNLPPDATKRARGGTITLAVLNQANTISKKMEENIMKKLTALLLALVMLLVIASGCTGTPTTEANDAQTSETAEPAATKDVKDMKVALIMLGAISDLGWDYTAYCGLEKIGALGAQTSYMEKVDMSEVEAVARNYASENYDVVFFATNMVQDIGLEVAKDFPDTQFIMISGDTVTDNMAAVQIKDKDQGFMMGVIAALATKSKVVGFIGATEFIAIVNGAKGFEQGVKYIDPEIKVLSTYTGSDTDVNLAKETAKAMIENGADVLTSICSAGAVGVLEAAQEGNVLAISESAGLVDVAPDAVLTTVNKDTSIAYEKIFKQYLEGTLSSEIETMGANFGVVFLDPWNAAVADEALGAEKEAQIEEIYQSLASGEIEVNID